MASEPLTPVTLLAGYLGSGKTTLVNHVLRNADGLRIAVMVNDFGDLPIDATLIVAEDGDIIQLSGGCVCCSYGNDLIRALTRLQELPNKPEHVLIECSGVAMPAPVKMSLSLIQGLAYDGTVGLIDGNQVLKQLADRYIGDTVARQIEQADVIFITKNDLITDKDRQIVNDRIATITTSVAVWIQNGEAPVEVILSSSVSIAQESRVERRIKDDNKAFAHTHAEFESVVVRSDASLNLLTLKTQLTSNASGVVRAKGFINADDNHRYLLQLVGDRCEFTQLNNDAMPSLPNNESAFVVIGVKGKLAISDLI